MKDLATLYGELFDLFINSKWAKDDLAAFKVQVGDNYCNGLLFIGRATNGWTSFCPVNLIEMTLCKIIVCLIRIRIFLIG